LKLAPREIQELCEDTKQLKTSPAPGFALHLDVSVAEALLFEWEAPPDSVAEGELHQRTAGTPGKKIDFDRVRKRMVFVLKGMKNVFGYPQKQYSSESLARRLGSPFFLLPGAPYPEVITATQQATADAARAKADAACAMANAACAKASDARPGTKLCYASPRLPPFPPPYPTHHLPISLCAGNVPIGGAAAEEGRDASSALGLGEVDGDGMDEATRAAIAYAYEGRKWRVGRRRGRRRVG
jgi:hypothetical protein